MTARRHALGIWCKVASIHERTLRTNFPLTQGQHHQICDVLGFASSSPLQAHGWRCQAAVQERSSTLQHERSALDCTLVHLHWQHFAYKPGAQVFFVRLHLEAICGQSAHVELTTTSRSVTNRVRICDQTSGSTMFVLPTTRCMPFDRSPTVIRPQCSCLDGVCTSHWHACNL